MSELRDPVEDENLNPDEVEDDGMGIEDAEVIDPDDVDEEDEG